jgi:hypothetical protein
LAYGEAVLNFDELIQLGSGVESKTKEIPYNKGSSWEIVNFRRKRQ